MIADTDRFDVFGCQDLCILTILREHVSTAANEYSILD
jgi:hypothetical protein